MTRFQIGHACKRVVSLEFEELYREQHWPTWKYLARSSTPPAAADVARFEDYDLLFILCLNHLFNICVPQMHLTLLYYRAEVTGSSCLCGNSQLHIIRPCMQVAEEVQFPKVSRLVSATYAYTLD